ncbi:MAG: hypothetical protein INR64_01440 [Caulobacteraceae bacterium]|nr:hypothetical protein [Caulobacter sp.]
MPEASPPSSPTVAAKLFSIDTPVGKLCVNPEAKAVVDRDLPGLTTRPEYVFFKHMSLRQLQAASRGQMSAAELDKVSIDLGAIDQPSAPFLRASTALP